MTASKRIVTLSGAGFIAVLLIGASCGGGGSAAPDGGGAGQTGGNAGQTGGGATTGPQGCAQVAQVLCMREIACAPADAGTTITQADCVRLEGISLTCDSATTEDFSACIGILKSTSCTDLDSASALPSCSNPINMIPLSDPQMKCGDFAQAVCQKSATCQGVTPTAAQLQNCTTQAYSDIGCSLAMSVGATFNQCLTDVGASSCPSADGGAGSDAGTALPSCDTAITFAQ